VIARVDFLWREERTVGEFDGRIKYGRLLQPGQTPEDVIFAEKVREDLLRDLGWTVVRWLWRDLYRSGVLRDRVLRALARNR
jgi:very-short-patch-repair endonuclease